MAKDGDIQQESEKGFEEVTDSLEGQGNFSTMQELEKIVDSILATLPKLNRRKLRLEMETFQVSLNQNPTTHDINEGLAHAQGYKDRLAEIYMMALREFKTRNRCVELLFDANNVISKGKSADVRRGEATMKYPMHLIQLEGAETFLKEVEHILQNVKSAHEAISRQASVMQIQLQLGEVRKSSGPRDYSNNSEAEEARPKNGPQELDW